MQTNWVAALTSHLLDDAEPVGSALWRDLRNSSGDVVQWARKHLSENDADKVAGLIARLDEIDQAIETLAHDGIHTISEFDDDYPQRWIEILGAKRPPLLFAAGNLALLNARSFGIVGSRDVDEKGAGFAAVAARIAVEQGLVVVSGGAKGVDQVSMNAAFEAGGESVGFLSDSLAKNVKGSMEALEGGRACLATTVSPHAGFNVANAMSRNKLIYAHSEATLIVSSAHRSGGTWAGAEEALKAKYCQVLVRDGDDVPDGNRALLRLGCVPVQDPREIPAALDAPVRGSLF